MHHLSRHCFLIAYYLRFSVEPFEEFSFQFRMSFEIMSEIRSYGALMYREVSIVSPLDNLSNRIGMYSVECS